MTYEQYDGPGAAYLQGLTDAELLFAEGALKQVATERGLHAGGEYEQLWEPEVSYPDLSDKRLNVAYQGYRAVSESLRSIGVSRGRLDIAEPEDFQLAYKKWQTPEMKTYKDGLRKKKEHAGLDYMLIATPNVTVSAKGLIALLTDIGMDHAEGTRVVTDENMQVLLKMYGDQEVSGTSPWDGEPAKFQFIPNRYIGKYGDLRKHRRAMDRMKRHPVTPTSMFNVATYLKTLALKQPDGKLDAGSFQSQTRFFLTDMGTQVLGNGEFIPSISIVKEGQLVLGHTSAHKSMPQRPAVGQRPPKQRRVYLEPYRMLWRALVNRAG